MHVLVPEARHVSQHVYYLHLPYTLSTQYHNNIYKIYQHSCPTRCTIYSIYTLSPVGSRVLVPESHHVSQLVNHDPELVAVLPNGDGLKYSQINKMHGK